MINKIYKRIHNKYSSIFKFFFFLRHVFIIFLISTALFFSVPKFFDYEKKDEIIKKYLINYYGLEMVDYKNIEYKILPMPNLSISQTNLKLKDKPINLKSNDINIFLDFKNIYNYENFKAKKIVFKQSEASLDIKDTQNLFNYFKKLKFKLGVKNINLNIRKDTNSLIKIKNINFSNYGYRKYYFDGEIFGEKFKASIKNNNKDLNFKLLNTGIKATLKLNEKFPKQTFEGSSKINLSNNLLSFNFSLKNNQLKLLNSNFRNKDLSFSLDSIIKYHPFFSFDSIIEINEINKNLIEKINLETILKKKTIIKKLNGAVTINYKSKKYFSELIDDYSSDIRFSYGRFIFSKKILIAGSTLNCDGETVLTENFPRLQFICLFNIKDKKKLFKKFSVSKNIDKEKLNLNIEGSLNLLNKKINFNKIYIDDTYVANKEDLKYFKDTFERTLFNDSFFKIFNKIKIKDFLLGIT